MANTPKAPIVQKNEQETNNTQSTDLTTRVVENVEKALTDTGKLVEDRKALVAETRDQLETEQKARLYKQDVKLDTLQLEQLDHQRTLAGALGADDAVSNADLMKSAKERAAKMKDVKRDTTKDNVHESKPSNWRIESIGDDKIRAVNIITHREFEGSPKDLMKPVLEA